MLRCVLRRNRPRRLPRCPYRSLRFYSIRQSETRERVTVPCHSNGHITLDIRRPTNAPEANTVVIYLPRGPLCLDDEKTASPIDVLKSLLPFTTVQLNYRLSRAHPFPTPIHDVLTGYDWVKEHLLPKRAISRAGRSEHVGKIAVCGELIGGGLAAALALTECRLGQPSIVAAAINNPILDWVEADEDGHSTECGMKDSHSSRVGKIRDQLFRKPEHYFDPFASPMLFLRSSGREVPSPALEAPSDDLAHLSYINREEFYRAYYSTHPRSQAQSTGGSFEETLEKTAKRYPSQALGLRLPPFYISAGIEIPFLCQAQEFSRRLRSSLVRQASAVDFGRKVISEEEIEALSEGERSEYDARYAEARDKVQLRTSRDLGSWDESDTGRARLAEMAQWLKQALS